MVFHARQSFRCEICGGDRTGSRSAPAWMNPVPERWHRWVAMWTGSSDQVEDRPGWDIELFDAAVRETSPTSSYRRATRLHAGRHRRVAKTTASAPLHRQPLHWTTSRPRRAGPADAERLCLDETLTAPARTKPRSSGRSAVVHASRRVGGLAATSRSMTCVLPVASDVCGGMLDNGNRRAQPTSTSQRCRASCIRATPHGKSHVLTRHHQDQELEAPRIMPFPVPGTVSRSTAVSRNGTESVEVIPGAD